MKLHDGKTLEENFIMLPIQEMTERMLIKNIGEFTPNLDFKYNVNKQTYLDLISNNNEMFKEIKPFHIPK